MKAIRDTLLFMNRNVQSPKSHFSGSLRRKSHSCVQYRYFLSFGTASHLDLSFSASLIHTAHFKPMQAMPLHLHPSDS